MYTGFCEEIRTDKKASSKKTQKNKTKKATNKQKSGVPQRSQRKGLASTWIRFLNCLLPPETKVRGTILKHVIL